VPFVLASLSAVTDRECRMTVVEEMAGFSALARADGTTLLTALAVA
jgi:hypothetical protein